MDHDDSLSGLLCPESKTCLDEDSAVLDVENEDEYVNTLGDKEISFGFKRGETDKSVMLSDDVKCARLEAIAWILNTRAVFGFRPKTAYLSVTYLDRFLSTRFIDSDKLWAIKLLSVACVSVAAKMEEVKVPALSELQNIDGYNFGNSVILRMELMLLTTMDWRMGSITPFSFLHHFIRKFCKDSSPSNVLPRTVALILAIMREINLMEHRPSAIAVAATLVAFDQKLTRQALESCCGFLEVGDVSTCYIIMQKLEMEKYKTPDLSATHFGTANVSSSAVSSKRKRLTFNDSDQRSDGPNEKRLR
ncbi:hypothetical protein AB3S75_012045 [Citrus x aurantiifolia]